MQFPIRLTARRVEGERFLWRRGGMPSIDASYGDPRLAAIRAAAWEGGAGKWPEIRARLAAAEGAEDLTFLVGGLGSVAGVERWIGDVAAAEPGDPLPLLVSGARHIEWAWHARTSAPAQDVSEEQWKLFRARLEIAEERLFEVAEREPEWAAPWYFLQISGRGLQVGPEVAERRFEATCRRAPGHLGAHRQQLQQLCAKWGGSHERMHAFAREAMLAAPAGSRLGELVAMAYLEQWLRIGGDPESAFMAGTEVIRALHEAAQRSVRHPDFVRDRDWTLGFNTFAMAFALSGEYRAARPLFRELRNQPTEAPWSYLNERSPLVPFLAWRTRVTR